MLPFIYNIFLEVSIARCTRESDNIADISAGGVVRKLRFVLQCHTLQHALEGNHEKRDAQHTH